MNREQRAAVERLRTLDRGDATGDGTYADLSEVMGDVWLALDGLWADRMESREIIKGLLPPAWALKLSDTLNQLVGEETEPRIKRARSFLVETDHLGLPIDV